MTMAAAHEADQRVRITITGVAHMLNRRNDASLDGVLRVVPDGDRRTVLLVDPRLDGVTVEPADEGRTWTAGDVVAGDVLVYVRDPFGTWYARPIGHSGVLTLGDAAVDEGTADGTYTVVRYQAGGDR